MAFIITFLSKATGDPTPPNQIDKEICARQYEGVDPRTYWHGWYGEIAMALAWGKTMEETRAMIMRDRRYELLHACDYLEENYTWDRYKNYNPQ
jgi:hypothetical protein